jgi:hypothetical protein
MNNYFELREFIFHYTNKSKYFLLYSKRHQRAQAVQVRNCVSCKDEQMLIRYQFFVFISRTFERDDHVIVKF